MHNLFLEVINLQQSITEHAEGSHTQFVTIVDTSLWDILKSPLQISFVAAFQSVLTKLGMASRFTMQ